MSAQPVPVFRISLANASLLSAAYLVVAVLVDLVRRAWNPKWIDRLALSLEAFPAKTLELFGLFEPLRDAWVMDRLTTTHVRLIYGATTITVIFALGLLVGVVMWLISKLARARVEPKPP